MSVTLETGSLQSSNECTQVDMARSLALVSDILPFNKCAPTGSVYTNGVGADCDVLVLGSKRDLYTLFSYGFRKCAATEYDAATSSDWTALRYGDTNVILVYCPELFKRWKSAGEVCRWLASTTKVQRVVLHEMIKNCVSMEVAIERATAG